MAVEGRRSRRSRLEGKNLVVTGAKKDVDDLHVEELWMKRIEVLEDQYDQHLIQLQKELLSSKVHGRVLSSLKNQHSVLKANLASTEKRSTALQKKVDDLAFVVKVKDSREHKLKSELEASNDRLKEQRFRMKQTEDLTREATRQQELTKRETLTLKTEQNKMATALKEKELELGQVRTEINELGKQSRVLAHTLAKAEAQRSKLEKAAVEAKTEAAFQRRERETVEEKMLRLKTELDEILKLLHGQQKETSELTRQKELTEKNLVTMRDELKKVLSKVTSTALETKYWKEEAEMLLKMAETPPKKLPTIQTKMTERQEQRSEHADLTRRLSLLEKNLAKMENEKILLKNKMDSVVKLQKSLLSIHQKNLASRKNFEEKLRQDGYDGVRRICKSKVKQEKQVIEKQGQQLKILEKELFKSQRVYNFLKLKLQHKSELEKNLSMAEVKLFRAEREKRQAETVGNQTARKLGLTAQSSRTDTSSLINNLLSQIKYVQDLREKLPRLEPRKMSTESGPGVQSKNLCNDGELAKVRDSLRALERKQAVYANIQAAKEHVAEEQLKRFQEEEELESEPEVTESSDTEEEETSLTESAPGVDAESEQKLITEEAEASPKD